MRRGEDIDHLTVFERDGWICQLCWTPIDPLIRFPDLRAASVDHVIPITCGGTHTYLNVQASHRYCNEAKSNGLTDHPGVV